MKILSIIDPLAWIKQTQNILLKNNCMYERFSRKFVSNNFITNL